MNSLYSSVIVNSLHFIEKGLSSKPCAKAMYQLYLSLEDLVGWIAARRGWLAGDDYGRAGILRCTRKLLRELYEIIDDKSHPGEATVKDLKEARRLVESDTASPGNVHLIALFTSLPQLKECLNRLRNFFLAQYNFEHLL